jgi:acetylornithine deacetylase/succinyl-diaminopimelate desuccinylase-like protein
MLVVPSVRGICHHPEEFTQEDDLVLGTEVLTRALWRLCQDGVAP